jgi:hypothetical protein
VSGEREPGIGPLTQGLRWHPENPAAGHSWAGREVDAVLVPRAEPACPAARYVRPRDDGVIAADVTPEVDDTVDEQPREVGVLALVEQVDAGLDTHLGAAIDQIRKARWRCRTQMDAAPSRATDATHFVEWRVGLLIGSTFGRPRCLPETGWMNEGTGQPGLTTRSGWVCSFWSDGGAHSSGVGSECTHPTR